MRVAKPPKALPLRTTRSGDGKGVRIAVLDTGLFTHPWLAAVQAAANSADVWDVDHDEYADAESGHGTFIAGLILQVAPAAEVYVVKVLDSHGVGDDAAVAKAMEQLPQDVDIVNLSLGGYTMDDAAPLAIACALNAMRKQRNVVVAAAGNAGKPRPFWPAAFKQVLAVGAVEEKDAHWQKADFSNFGWWVDAAARGVNLQSTFTKGKTRKATGPAPDPADPWISFEGWAAWDGTSFASPITAGDDRPHDVAQRLRERRRRAGAPALDVTAGAAARLPARRPGGRAPTLDRRPGDRDLRSPQQHVQPHHTGPQAVEREAPELVGLHREPVLARPLDRHGRRRGREQLALQAALARPGGDDLEFDPEPWRLETQLPWPAPAAHQFTRLLLCAVAHQFGELVVHGAPGEGGPGGSVEQLRDGVHVREDRTQLGFGDGVLVGHSSSLRSVAETPSPSASPRRRSRHRARVGPMLPIGMSRADAISS